MMLTMAIRLIMVTKLKMKLRKKRKLKKSWSKFQHQRKEMHNTMTR